MTPTKNSSGAPGPRVVTGTLHRVQRGHAKRFTPEAPPRPVRRPARVAVMLALAHKIQQAIDAGTVPDRAQVARRLRFTRARVTHLMDLTLLAPDLQEHVLRLEAVDGVEPISERELRKVARTPPWREQRAVAAPLLKTRQKYVLLLTTTEAP